MNANQISIQKLFGEAVKNHLRGDFAGALSFYEKILAIYPAHPDTIKNIGAIYLAMGDNQKAIDFLERALELDENSPDALNNLATALKNQKRFEEALVILKRALSLKPDFVEACFNLGNLYRDMGLYKQAIDAFTRTVSLNPVDYESLNNLGALFCGSGRFKEAKEACLRSIVLRPDYASAHYNLGNAYLHQGDFDEAARSFSTAVSLAPDFSDSYLNLGNVMQRLGKTPDAIVFFQRAIEANPKSPEAYYNLGLALEMEGDLVTAISTQKAAMQACPDSVHSWIGSARMLMKIADWPQADALMKNVLSYDFSESECALLSDALFLLHSLPLSDEIIFEKHRLWGDLAVQTNKKLFPDTVFDFDPLRQDSAKIRVGYVSPDFCRHSVGWFFKHIVSHHNPEQFEICCYGSDRREDDLTEQIKRMVAVFRRVHSLDSADLARTIYEDRVDILVDLSGHTKGNRLDVFALGPAPILVTAIGYPHGTGLKTMNYRITDHRAETPSSMANYRENLVFLPRCFLPIGPFDVDDVMITRKDLGLPASGVLLASFNRADKMRPEVLSLWNRLLTRCPDAILALGCGYVNLHDLKTNILSYFPSKENKERVFFIKRAHSEELHRARYRLVDLALDTFPYAGTTTSYEALGMNIPVVTLTGERHVQRTTHSILAHLGLIETVAHTEQEYLDKAAALIENKDLLEQTKIKLTQSLRTKVEKDPRDYTKALEEAYLIMWNRYQKGDPPTEISF